MATPSSGTSASANVAPRSCISYNECRWYCDGKPVLLTGRLVMIGESVGYENGDRGDTGLSLLNSELEFMNACGAIGIAMPG